jgi:hypothetical protein
MSSTPVASSSSISAGNDIIGTPRKPVVLPNEGYGAIASKKPVSNQSDTRPNNDRGGWSAANTQSQQELMHEIFSKKSNDVTRNPQHMLSQSTYIERCALQAKASTAAHGPDQGPTEFNLLF